MMRAIATLALFPRPARPCPHPNPLGYKQFRTERGIGRAGIGGNSPCYRQAIDINDGSAGNDGNGISATLTHARAQMRTRHESDVLPLLPVTYIAKSLIRLQSLVTETVTAVTAINKGDGNGRELGLSRGAAIGALDLAESGGNWVFVRLDVGAHNFQTTHYATGWRARNGGNAGALVSATDWRGRATPDLVGAAAAIGRLARGAAEAPTPTPRFAVSPRRRWSGCVAVLLFFSPGSRRLLGCCHLTANDIEASAGRGMGARRG